MALAGAPKSTELRGEQIVQALAATSVTRTDVDDVLEALVGHQSSAVRADAALALASRRPDQARSLWAPWLSSRSTNERRAAEMMITRYGLASDLPEVIRITTHRSKPPTGTTHWPPLAAESIDFLVRHRAEPDAADALDALTARWSRLDDDLRRWISENHADLVPGTAADDGAAAN